MSDTSEREVCVNTDEFRIKTFFDQSHRIRDAKNRYRMALPEDRRYDFLAINVPSTYQQGLIPDGEEPPWGLLRVVASARETHGYGAGILDAHRLKLSLKDIAAQIERSSPRIVGLNPTSVNVPEAIAIARICDERNIRYILGGIHATLDPIGARRDFPSVAAIVRGNGEIAVGEVLSVLLRDAQPTLPGVWYRGQLPLVDTYAPKLNPGEIPMVRQNVYVEQPVYTHTVFDGARYRKIREATLFVTYGCPFDCTFCSSPIMVDRGNSVPYMRPGVPRILREVEHVVRDLGADAVHFLDDMAFVSGRQIRDFHQGVVDFGLQGEFVWRGLTKAAILLRPDFDDETMRRMRESGCWKIALGVESGNDAVLERIRKHTTTDQMREAVRKLTRHGIQAKGFFILGFPGETRSQIEDTVRFVSELKELGMSEASVFQFKPYPGTLEYRLLAERRPETLDRLEYLKRSVDDLRDRAKKRAEEHAWLPDDLRIAEIPSGEVRRYVMRALESFYGDRVVSHYP